MVVRNKGSESKEEHMPGGSPQGTILGVLIFIIQMTFLRNIPFNPEEQSLSLPGVKNASTSCKFIDDLTTATSLSLNDLQVNENLLRP